MGAFPYLLQHQRVRMPVSARTKQVSDNAGQAAQASPTETGKPAKPSVRAKNNERPLVEDIRLLGRILGDVIRDQEGVAAYRADRAGPQAVGGVPPRCRPGGRQGAQEAAQGLERRPDRQRDPRLHLFQPPGQSGRRPPPHPPPRHSRARRRHPGRQHRSRAGAPALGRHRAQDHRATRWRTALSRRCSPPTRPRCSARASWTPSATSPSC